LGNHGVVLGAKEGFIVIDHGVMTFSTSKLINDDLLFFVLETQEKVRMGSSHERVCCIREAHRVDGA